MPAEGWGRIWRWPLYSPRRLIGTVLVLLLVIAVPNVVLSRGANPAPPPPPAQAGGTTTAPNQPGPSGTAGGLPTAGTDANGTAAPPAQSTVAPTVSPRPPRPNARQEVGATALAFTTAWARPDRPQAQWFAEVSKYADVEFRPQLAKTDPTEVPATKVTGVPTVVSVTFASGVVEVPTDGGTVVVSLIHDEKDNPGWRVTDIRPKG